MARKQGNLRVRRELEDHSEFHARKPEVEEEAPKEKQKDDKAKGDQIPNPSMDKYRRPGR